MFGVQMEDLARCRDVEVTHICLVVKTLDMLGIARKGF